MGQDRTAEFRIPLPDGGPEIVVPAPVFGAVRVLAVDPAKIGISLSRIGTGNVILPIDFERRIVVVRESLLGLDGFLMPTDKSLRECEMFTFWFNEKEKVLFYWVLVVALSAARKGYHPARLFELLGYREFVDEDSGVVVGLGESSPGEDGHGSYPCLVSCDRELPGFHGLDFLSSRRICVPPGFRFLMVRNASSST